MPACRDQKQALFLVPKVSAEGKARPLTNVLTDASIDVSAPRRWEAVTKDGHVVSLADLVPAFHS